MRLNDRAMSNRWVPSKIGSVRWQATDAKDIPGDPGTVHQTGGQRINRAAEIGGGDRNRGRGAVGIGGLASTSLTTPS